MRLSLSCVKKYSTKFKFFIIIILLATSFFGFIITALRSYKENGSLAFIDSPPTENTAFRKIAYIAGEISNPGVYEISEDTRIFELIEVAGGLTDAVDTNYIASALNLAKIVNNEEKIFIPAVERENVTSQIETDAYININNASLEDLDTLPGIGPSIAQKIIDNRPYQSIEDLKNVSGIGDSKFEDIKSLINVE